MSCRPPQMLVLLCLVALLAVSAIAEDDMPGTWNGGTWQVDRSEARHRLLVDELTTVELGDDPCARLILDAIPNYRRMRRSPYTFYRRAVRVFDRDLATASLIEAPAFASGVTSRIHGNATPRAFGVVTAKSSGAPYLQLDGFEFSRQGHPRVDVARLAVGIWLVTRHLEMDRQVAASAVRAYAAAYLEESSFLAGMELPSSGVMGPAESNDLGFVELSLVPWLERARGRTRADLLEQWLNPDFDAPRLSSPRLSSPRLVVPTDIERQWIEWLVGASPVDLEIVAIAQELYPPPSPAIDRYILLVRSAGEFGLTTLSIHSKPEGESYPVDEPCPTSFGRRDLVGTDANDIACLVGTHHTLELRGVDAAALELPERLYGNSEAVHTMADHWARILAVAHHRVAPEFTRSVAEVGAREAAAFVDLIDRFAETYSEQVAVDYLWLSDLFEQARAGR